MIKSVCDNIDDVRALAASGNVSKNLARGLVDVSESLLADIANVLAFFDAATKLLSDDHKPTLHLVVATLYKLKSELASLPTDSVVIKQFKEHLRTHLSKYATATD